MDDSVCGKDTDFLRVVVDDDDDGCCSCFLWADLNALTKDVVAFFGLQLESPECSMVIKLRPCWSLNDVLLSIFSLLVVYVVGVTCCARWFVVGYFSEAQQQLKHFGRLRREMGGKGLIGERITRTAYYVALDWSSETRIQVSTRYLTKTLHLQ